MLIIVHTFLICFSGVSTYQAGDGDHVVFQFAHWDIKDRVPKCPPDDNLPPAGNNSISITMQWEMIMMTLLFLVMRYYSS